MLNQSHRTLIIIIIVIIAAITITITINMFGMRQSSLITQTGCDSRGCFYLHALVDVYMHRRESDGIQTPRSRGQGCEEVRQDFG